MSPTRNIRSNILSLSLLVSLLISGSAGVRHPKLANACEGLCGRSAFTTVSVKLNTDALTTSPGSPTRSHASKQTRTKLLTPLLAVVTGKLHGLNTRVSRRIHDAVASQADSASCFSRPQGRAPPPLA